MTSLSQPSMLSDPALRAKVLEAMERELSTRLSQNRLRDYRPYKKQADFHAAGATFRERLLMAGNQLGKTWSASYETAMHLTGRYPSWWQGKVYRKPVMGWAAGVTGETTRDTVQRLLLGRPGQFGTGAIPKADIDDIVSARGVADLVDTIRVKNVDGGVSMLGLKSYEKGREKWQGETLDFVWFDEEPPPDIYTEGLTRTNATGGLAWMTFTPLLGMTDVVGRFLLTESVDRHVTQMTIDDAEHYTPEQRARIIASYPEHEREARAKGVPTLGSGRVFPVAEEAVKCEPFPIPKHWPQIGGIDFGWDHPSAAARLAWDRDADTVYVIATHRAREQTPVLFAGAVRSWGKWLPWAWPHDGLQHDKGSGEQLAAQYREQGLNLLHERATFADGSNGLEAGVMEMLDRMQTGRWKVFSNCAEWFEEFRLYHRKDGLIVKERDDLISASRYGMMMLRAARVERKAASESGGLNWLA
jgi:phage terminase large subunit-like protein